MGVPSSSQCASSGVRVVERHADLQVHHPGPASPASSSEPVLCRLGYGLPRSINRPSTTSPFVGAARICRMSRTHQRWNSCQQRRKQNRLRRFMLRAIMLPPKASIPR